jgi:hypothetical protein
MGVVMTVSEAYEAFEFTYFKLELGARAELDLAFDISFFVRMTPDERDRAASRLCAALESEPPRSPMIDRWLQGLFELANPRVLSRMIGLRGRLRIPGFSDMRLEHAIARIDPGAADWAYWIMSFQAFEGLIKTTYLSWLTSFRISVLPSAMLATVMTTLFDEHHIVRYNVIRVLDKWIRAENTDIEPFLPRAETSDCGVARPRADWRRCAEVVQHEVLWLLRRAGIALPPELASKIVPGEHPATQAPLAIDAALDGLAGSDRSLRAAAGMALEHELRRRRPEAFAPLYRDVWATSRIAAVASDTNERSRVPELVRADYARLLAAT